MLLSYVAKERISSVTRQEVFGICSEKSPQLKSAFIHQHFRNPILTCDAGRLLIPEAGS
jgi:hypothetical protein